MVNKIIKIIPTRNLIGIIKHPKRQKMPMKLALLSFFSAPAGNYVALAMYVSTNSNPDQRLASGILPD